MLVAAIIRAILLFQGSAMSKPIGSIHDAEVASTAGGIETRQLLLLDDKSHSDEIDLKKGMDLYPANLEELHGKSTLGDPAFAPGPRARHLAHRIFLSVPTDAEEQEPASH
ncbi:hypothetical protein J7T55_001217 [Diaporthe amygdali]|uniref:uncharacterized protein n=1 Tax=Phomopsis amygdali TaxID=1214568 RepID=UPI0022FF02C2|nr:uncharacterized protein J7T55_001217 [Diaporthe amygdali]KAJ0103761.1 hypothetical protein J7T55_001217 [Diaporthe amygdali]